MTSRRSMCHGKATGIGCNKDELLLLMQIFPQMAPFRNDKCLGPDCRMYDKASEAQ